MPGSEERAGERQPRGPGPAALAAALAPPAAEEAADVLDFHLHLALEREAGRPPEDPIALWDSAI